MIGPLETLRDTANSWECDENDHINVQFYAARFDSAVRVFLVEAGWQVPHRVTRLIRYHAELRGGEPVHCTTAMVDLGRARLGLEHRLYASQRGNKGVLSATALDMLQGKFADQLEGLTVPAASEDALPRSGTLGGLPMPLYDAVQPLPVTFRGVIPPGAFGSTAESGNGPMLTDRHLVGMISDAATHAWAQAGADDAWLRARGWGRAAVQLRLNYGHRPTAGDVVRIHTGLHARSDKTISYRHHVVNVMREELIAVADITSLMLNLETRRAMAWPHDKLANLDAQIASFQNSNA